MLHDNAHQCVEWLTGRVLVRCRRFAFVQHMVEDVDKAALLIAAAIHDLDHMGRTTSFLVNAEHSLALLYNDM